MYLNWYSMDKFGQLHYSPLKLRGYIKRIKEVVSLNKRLKKGYFIYPVIATKQNPHTKKWRFIILWLWSK